MSTAVIACFGGTGKTSLIYHLSWMYADLGIRVVAVALDPKSNLSAEFLSVERLEELWLEENHVHTVFGSLQPLLRGEDEIAGPHLEPVSEAQLPSFAEEANLIALLVGDPLLSSFEIELARLWPECSGNDAHTLRGLSAFWNMLQKAATAHDADIVLLDLGSNLGAVNHAALIATDYIVTPLVSDLFSLQGIRNLGSTLRYWHSGWQGRLASNTAAALPLPRGRMQPIGYVALEQPIRLDRPTQYYDRWLARIPADYRSFVLEELGESHLLIGEDPRCLALLRPYRSLIALAQEAHKPTFALKPADGATGSFLEIVQETYKDFRQLARKIAQEIGLALP